MRQGFDWVRCWDCGHEYLLAYFCKGDTSAPPATHCQIVPAIPICSAPAEAFASLLEDSYI